MDPRVLPKTIEGATERYLTHYENNFVGSAEDMFRLRNLARKFIYKLRKKAPKFYEEKLPQLVNQAASTLLTFNIADRDELKKFHETHAYFLVILQELGESQPSGEVNFHSEKTRHEQRARLIKLQAALAKSIDELEAAEIDFDELGDDDIDCKYEQVFSRLEALKREQRTVNMELAVIEGQQIEELPEFHLRVKPNSILNRLTKEQLSNLEDQMLEFYKVHDQKRTALYLNKSSIDEMIDKLDIDKSKFQQEELRHLSKDALDSYKSYYREKDQAMRDEFHQDLLSNERLRPKEGLILDDPDCLPEHVKRRLEENLSKCRTETELLLDEFTSRQEIEQIIEEQVSDESGEEDNINEAEAIKISLKARGVELARTTEPPRDDYVEDECSDDESEIYVEEDK